MAGDWIKMRNDLSDDPAVIAVASRVGLDEFAVVGRLHALWAWADSQSRDGHAPGVTAAWLDRKVARDGFAAALVDVGWLDVDEDGLRIPNFEHHNGATAKTRALATRRKQVERGAGRPESVTPPVAPAVPLRSPVRHATAVTEPRPEKRREELKETPPTPRKRVAVARFDEFWLAWPRSERKQDKAKCFEHWRRNALDGTADVILADVKRKRGSEKWRNGYDEAPLVYLRGRRWEDEAAAGDPAELGEWHETRGGAEKKAAELGLPKWTETEPFPAYIARIREHMRTAEAVPA